MPPIQISFQCHIQPFCSQQAQVHRSGPGAWGETDIFNQGTWGSFWAARTFCSAFFIPNIPIQTFSSSPLPPQLHPAPRSACRPAPPSGSSPSPPSAPAHPAHRTHPPPSARRTSLRSLRARVFASKRACEPAAVGAWSKAAR